jgi:hypothetical protein
MSSDPTEKYRQLNRDLNRRAREAANQNDHIIANYYLVRPEQFVFQAVAG